MRHLFFIVNFGVALLFMMACVYSIGAMETPASFLGGIMFLAPAAAFAIAEWLAWYRNRSNILRVLSICCLVLSGIAIFGIVANLAEAVYEGLSLDGIGSFIAIGLAISVYLAGCGIYRLRTIMANNHRRRR